MPDTSPGPGGDWLGELLGPRAARVLTTYAVPCLHYAHWQALWRYRLADWTNETTYGTDRYHCLCETFGRIAADRLPGARGVGPKGAAALLRKYATIEDAFSAGHLAGQAEQLRLYRRIAVMDASAPLPAIPDQSPRWEKAAALARDWELNRLAQRLEDLAKAEAL